MLLRNECLVNNYRNKMSEEKDKAFRRDSENTEWKQVEEETEEIAIDVDSGERVSIEIVADDNQDDEDGGPTTTDTVVFGLPEATNEADGLTTNQILLAILGALNDRNKLAQETNKRLRDQNKILRRMAGLTAPTDKTLQGTPPKQPNTIDNTGVANNDFTIRFPE